MRRIQKVVWCRLRAPCDQVRGREYGSRLTQSSSCAATLLSWLAWRSLCDHGACPLMFTALLLAPRAAWPVSESSSCAVEDLSCKTQRRDIAIPCDVRGTHYAWKVDLFPLIQTLKIFLLCGLNMAVCQVSSLNACLLLSNSFQNF